MKKIVLLFIVGIGFTACNPFQGPTVDYLSNYVDVPVGYYPISPRLTIFQRTYLNYISVQPDERLWKRHGYTLRLSDAGFERSTAVQLLVSAELQNPNVEKLQVEDFVGSVTFRSTEERGPHGVYPQVHTGVNTISLAQGEIYGWSSEITVPTDGHSKIEMILVLSNSSFDVTTQQDNDPLSYDVTDSVFDNLVIGVTVAQIGLYAPFLQGD